MPRESEPKFDRELMINLAINGSYKTKEFARRMLGYAARDAETWVEEETQDHGIARGQCDEEVSDEAMFAAIAHFHDHKGK